VRPSSVKEYSTFGETTGYISRATVPFSSDVWEHGREDGFREEIIQNHRSTWFRISRPEPHIFLRTQWNPLRYRTKNQVVTFSVQAEQNGKKVAKRESLEYQSSHINVKNPGCTFFP
jgi:hypothetical protein